jgi:hypothetical protein
VHTHGRMTEKKLEDDDLKNAVYCCLFHNPVCGNSWTVRWQESWCEMCCSDVIVERGKGVCRSNRKRLDQYKALRIGTSHVNIVRRKHDTTFIQRSILKSIKPREKNDLHDHLQGLSYLDRSTETLHLKGSHMLVVIVCQNPFIQCKVCDGTSPV